MQSPNNTVYPILYSSQYTGAISGTIRSYSGYQVMNVTVFLLKDGKIVERPDNPQSSFERNFSGKSVDYLFENLTPGKYTVVAEYFAPNKFNETVSVDVNTTPITINIILTHLRTQPTYSTASTPSPNRPKPMPAISWISIPLILGVATYKILKKK